jgi:hypothetical protein
MKIERWKGIAFAACLTASAAFVCHAAAATRVRAVAARGPCVSRPAIRGEGLLRVGGYALNVRFTPEGRLLGFDITAAPAKSASGAGSWKTLH